MQNRARELTFLILAGFFITNAIVAEIIGGKLFAVPAIDLGLFQFPSVVLSIGVILWPVVFITTDLVNEYFGRAGVRRLSFLTAGMIAYVFVLLQVLRLPPSAGFPNTVPDAAFDAVFGQSQWIIVGSLLAFLVGQFVDVAVFHRLRRISGPRALWLRSTGSTVVSQLIDTLVVLWVGLGWPNGWDLATFARVAVLEGEGSGHTIATGVDQLVGTREDRGRIYGKAESRGLHLRHGSSPEWSGEREERTEESGGNSGNGVSSTSARR